MDEPEQGANRLAGDSPFGKAVARSRLLFMLSGMLWMPAADACLHGCIYSAGGLGPTRFEHCAREKGDGTFGILPEHLTALGFDNNGLATVRIKDQDFYVDRQGRMLPVVTYDNWADWYSEGLVRSLVRGKIAYYDTSFEQVIAPKYDWGWPFRNGRALVCAGCRIAEPDEHGKHLVVDGMWGYIDRSGNEVVPVIYPRAILPPVD